MPEKRAFRPWVRKSGVRDSRLIIIASEGTNTEKYYFENLVAAYFNPRIHVEVLDRIETGSDSQRVLRQLDNFRREYKIKQKDDELWLVIDVDRWRSAKLADVARLALQKKVELAVSNPCFELWLLLHHRDLGEYSPEILHELHLNRKE